MEQNEELRQKLLKLASAGNGRQGKRVLRRRGGSSLLAAVLGELDDLVLSRRLVLERNDRQTLTLVAANRSLVEVETEEPGTNTLTAQDTAQLEALRSRLDGFLLGQESITIRVERTSQALNGGVSARFLATAWDEAASPSAQVDAKGYVGSFLARHYDSITAWCHKNGECVESGGDRARYESVQELLQTMEQTLLPPRNDALQIDSKDFFFVLGPEEENSEVLVFAGRQESLVVFLTTESDFPTVAARWNSAPENWDSQVSPTEMMRA